MEIDTKKLLKQFFKNFFTISPRLKSGVNENHWSEINHFNGIALLFQATGF